MNTSDYYNEFFELGQQKINFSFYEIGLPADDEVHTLNSKEQQLKKQQKATLQKSAA